MCCLLWCIYEMHPALSLKSGRDSRSPATATLLLLIAVFLLSRHISRSLTGWVPHASWPSSSWFSRINTHDDLDDAHLHSYDGERMLCGVTHDSAEEKDEVAIEMQKKQMEGLLRVMILLAQTKRRFQVLEIESMCPSPIRRWIPTCRLQFTTDNSWPLLL
jgi:hypothetical protein